MKFETRKEGDFTIVSPSGEIDFHYSPQLREQVLAGLDDGQHVVVDLSDVTYIDSSGIASLVEGLQHAKGKGLEFSLAGVMDGVMQVLKLTRLDNVFTIHQSVADAVARQ